MLGDYSAVSISPQNSPALATSQPPPVGGIDLRSLPLTVQPAPFSPRSTVKDFIPSAQQLSSPNISHPAANLDSRWQEIERMLNADIIPSTERIREYIFVTCQSQDCALRIEKILKALAGVLRLQETYCRPLEPALKELLILLESDKPPRELQLALGR